MKYKIPKTFMGIPVEGAIERALKKQDNEDEDKNHFGENNLPDTQNMIYVPSINLYVTKERILHGNNWFDTHKELHKQNLRMPLISEFLGFVNYLKSQNSNQEYQKILDEILTVRDPWRSEWLDADFKYLDRNGNKVSSEGAGELYIYSNHIVDLNGSLIAQKKEKLESCLMKDCYADVFGSANSQGLPTKELGESQGGIYYGCPMKDNISVAGFVAGSDGASLDCSWDPDVSDVSLGVFGVARSAAP